MKRTEIAFMSIRILAVYVFIRALDRLFIDVYQIFVQILVPNGDVKMIVTGIIPICMYVLFGILLWFYSEKISQHLLLTAPDKEENACLQLREMQVIAYSVVGLVILVITVPELLNKLANLILIKESLKISPPQIKIGTYLYIIEKAIQCVIGLVLFLGAKGLAGILQIVREAGTSKGDL